MSLRRIAALSAAGALLMGGEASATQVECPSVTVTRVPIPSRAHSGGPSKPRRVAAHRPSTTPRRTTTVAALHVARARGPRPAAKPDLTRPLPTLAPILPPDTLPATEPVLGAAPAATPIVGYRLKRSVKMVACQSVPLLTSRDLVQQLAGPPGGPGFAPASPTLLGVPPTQPLLVSTLPGVMTPPGGPGGPGTPSHPPTLGAIPEPATWAMLIVGFFGLGARLRIANRRLRRADVAPTRNA